MELGKGPGIQFFPDSLHKVVVEIQVVHHRQAHPQHFIGFLQMADIGTAEIAADRAITFRINGAFVPLILQIFNIDDAVPGKQMTMACVAAGHDTVKQVHTPVNAFNDVAGRADPYRILSFGA